MMIEPTLTDDTILNKINKQFISLDPRDVKNNNQFLKVIEELMKLMQQQNILFKKTYQKIVWAGSYYKNTRIGEPEEYDVNLVINLPIAEKDMEIISNCPGYVKIRIKKSDNFLLEKCMDPEYREMKKLIDKFYLKQNTFRTWIEGILDKVLHAEHKIEYTHGKLVQIKKVQKSGPAFTLSVDIPNFKIINIDLVPVLAFHNLPSKESSKRLKHNPNLESRCWFAIPKPLNNNNKNNFYNEKDLYWRTCFYEYEKDILSQYGRIKPIIRLLKKLRDTKKWKSIASYYIETLCLHELNIFKTPGKEMSNTALFFMMLQKLYDAFHNRNLNSYWYKKLNLFDNIKDTELKNMEGNLNNIIKDIKKNIINDRFAIARHILNETEFYKLYNNLQTQTETNSDSNQSKCVIV